MARQWFPWFLLAGALTLMGCSGTDGRNAKPCTITRIDGGASLMVCPDGTSAVLSDGTAIPAIDGGATNCTIQPADGGLSRIVCPDGTTVLVGPGAPGASGAKGTSCTITAPDGGGARVLVCSDGTSQVLPTETEGTGLRVSDLHGMSYLLSTDDFAGGAKTLVNATITSATADLAGVVTVKFTVKNKDGSPVIKLGSFNANIAKLVPTSATGAPSEWVPYIYRTRTSGSATALQGSRENNGALTSNNDGSYTYVFKTNLATAVKGTTPIPYTRNLTHRVSIMLGGHSGPTADATFDFVPDGSPLTGPRPRHRPDRHVPELPRPGLLGGHGGDRLTSRLRDLPLPRPRTRMAASRWTFR